MPDTAIRWVQPDLLNGWTVYDTVQAVPAYTKDPFGFVHLRGLVKRTAGSSNLPILVLPRGFRPGKPEVFIAHIGTAAPAFTFGRIDVASNGEVAVIVGDGSLYTSLAGITFRAER